MQNCLFLLLVKRNYSGRTVYIFEFTQACMRCAVRIYQTSTRTLTNTSYWKGISRAGMLARIKPITPSRIAATRTATTAPSLCHRPSLATLDDHSPARRRRRCRCRSRAPYRAAKQAPASQTSPTGPSDRPARRRPPP